MFYSKLINGLGLIGRILMEAASSCTNPIWSFYGTWFWGIIWFRKP